MTARKRRIFRLEPNWTFPFRVMGKDCIFVAQPVWNVRWTRLLDRKQRLIRAQQFRERLI